MQTISNNPIQPVPIQPEETNGIVRAKDLNNLEHYHQQLQGLFSTFRPNIHFRIIPSRRGGDTSVLTKAGAERICLFLGLTQAFIPQTNTTIIDYQNGFFCFSYECKLFKDGVFIGNGFGNCNNKEEKYVKQVGFDIINTIDRMAQKRALVAATLFCTGASTYFGQKLRDLN